MIINPTGSRIERERLTRLRHLVRLNASDVVIVDECLLVVLAAFGNNYWYASWTLLCRAVRRLWEVRVYNPFRRLLHRFGVCWLDEDGLCYICGIDLDEEEGDVQ